MNRKQRKARKMCLRRMGRSTFPHFQKHVPLAHVDTINGSLALTVDMLQKIDRVTQ